MRTSDRIAFHRQSSVEGASHLHTDEVKVGVFKQQAELEQRNRLAVQWQIAELFSIRSGDSAQFVSNMNRWVLARTRKQ